MRVAMINVAQVPLVQTWFPVAAGLQVQGNILARFIWLFDFPVAGCFWITLSSGLLELRV